jgi:hypothetical protein
VGRNYEQKNLEEEHLGIGTTPAGAGRGEG